jgi:hypothetical protein
VDWVEAFCHIVNRDEIGDSGQTMEKVVFEPEAWGWSDDGGFGEELPSDFFADCLSYASSVSMLSIARGFAYLCPKNFRWRVFVRIVTRHLNESVDIILRHRLSNPLRALNIDIPQTEILRRIILPNQIEHNITVPDTLLNTLRISQVELHECDPSEIASDFEVTLGHVVAVGDYHLATTPGEALHDVSA